MRVVLISDFFADMDALAAAAARYAALGAKGVMLQIIDPVEEMFPFKGRTEFADVESRDRLTFGDSAALGDQYRKVFAAHRQSLITLANRFQWTFLAHRTDAPASAALLSLYAALADHRGRAW